jgi:hypothetical protein
MKGETDYEEINSREGFVRLSFDVWRILSFEFLMRITAIHFGWKTERKKK